MTEYIHYFWVGFDSMGRFPLFRNAFIFLCCVVLVIVIRRLTASLRSGGSFFEAYRIAEGNFYIHGAIQFGPRTIPLKDIRSIQVHHVRGRYGSGNRYMVYLERKKGRTITVIVGESARNCRLMESLRADTRKYGRYIVKRGSLIGRRISFFIAVCKAAKLLEILFLTRFLNERSAHFCYNKQDVSAHVNDGGVRASD